MGIKSGTTTLARARRARQLIALTLLAELKTNQRNLLSLMLDKSTFWTEDRKALRLPPLSPEAQASLVKNQAGPRLLRLRSALFTLAPKPAKDSRHLIYKDDVYQPRLPAQIEKPSSKSKSK